MNLPDNVKRLIDRVDETCRSAGRDPGEITIVAAGKYATAEQIREVTAAGIATIGENRVADADAKRIALREEPIRWHMIGHLQKNKARRALEIFEMIQSVDSISLAERLERILAEMEEIREILLQVNVGMEPTKTGFAPEEVEEAFDHIASLDHLRPRGLMAIPPYHPDPESVRPWFRRMRTIFDGLAGRYSCADTLSMGMSEDFSIAIEEGATMIRPGRILFSEVGA